MKVLVLGNGAHVKKRVLPALNNIKSIENIIIGDRNTKNAIKIDSKNEIRNFNDELKSSEKYNFVIIATPPYDHKSSLIKVSDKTENILVEKPISNDINFIFGENLRELKNEKNVFETLMYLHHPLWSYVKDLINKKNIQKVFSEFSVPHLPENSFRYKKELGGGSLFDQGIYPISLAQEISNSSQVLNSVEIHQSREYEVDLGGSIDLTIDENISYIGKWGLGQEYKNYLKLENSDGESFQIDFIFSKPNETFTKIDVKNSKNSQVIEVGKYDQFQIMYQDVIEKNITKFKYTNYENLLKRYSLVRDVLKVVN
tara:strand:+ start:722 stop:1663 length:942 start_codon:yes stop_codon:yes gene_type:complete